MDSNLRTLVFLLAFFSRFVPSVYEDPKLLIQPSSVANPLGRSSVRVSRLSVCNEQLRRLFGAGARDKSSFNMETNVI